MEPGTTRYTVECLRAGQPCPYADSLWEYILTIEWIPCIGPNQTDWQPRDLTEQIVRNAVRTLCKDFSTKDKPEWHEPKLTTFQKRAPGVWRAIIKQAYLD